MKEYMKDMFETAIYTDLHIFTDEPTAMISLITLEDIADDIDTAIKMCLLDMAISTVIGGISQ